MQGQQIFLVFTPTMYRFYEQKCDNVFICPSFHDISQECFLGFPFDTNHGYKVLCRKNKNIVKVTQGCKWNKGCTVRSRKQQCVFLCVCVSVCVLILECQTTHFASKVWTFLGNYSIGLFEGWGCCVYVWDWVRSLVEMVRFRVRKVLTKIQV